MKHVLEIRQLLENDQEVAAEEALLELLSLAPQNTEALELLADLYHKKGLWEEEGQLWERILRIDEQNQRALLYALEISTMEHVSLFESASYFVLPYRLAYSTLFGTLGGLIFLIAQHIFEDFWHHHLTWLLILFAGTVLTPWWFFWKIKRTSISEIKLSWEGMKFSVGITHYFWSWSSLDFYLCSKGEKLTLWCIPENQKITLKIPLDLSSSLKNRRSFLKNVKFFSKKFQEVQTESFLSGETILTL